MNLTDSLKRYAYSIGFQDVGISKSEYLNEEARNLEQWLSKSYNGEMGYMNNHFDLRVNPQLLHHNTQSIISLSYNYFVDNDDQEEIKISKYSRGKDYHKVIKKKLKLLIKWLENEAGEISARGFVDSAPVMERVWAQKSGVGWIGKNSLLLTKSKGSFFFLAELFVDIELDYDSPVKDYCGNCTRCIDSCPTQAIVEPYVVDSNKCISYLTIEYKDQFNEDQSNKLNNWAFGCDICQDVCPINARAEQHSEPEFESEFYFHKFSKEKWKNLTEEQFNEIFHDTPVKRTGYKGLMRNINANLKY